MIDFSKAAQSIAEDLIAWRRDFHQHPELRFQEFRTSQVIASHLQNWGLEVTTGIGKTGVTGLLQGAHAGKVILMRFDMDALPIQEENNTAYASQNPGVMHACGHDAHSAIGLGVARLLAAYREHLCGSIKFVFQPAEEGAGGALAMIEDGVLENPRPDYSFGVHVDAQRPVGQVSIGEGPILAAADTFRIVISGRGGHGALPEQAIDALMAGVQVINMLQTINSRNLSLLEAAVISVCSFQAGSAFNIIPESAEILGTIRTYEKSVQQLIHRRIKEISETTASALGASAEVSIQTIVPAAINDPEVTAIVRQLAAQLYGAENIELDYRVAPSDDMAEFLQAAPGCHIIIGSALPVNFPHHNPRFDIDEQSMTKGVALFCNIAFHFLNGTPTAYPHTSHLS